MVKHSEMMRVRDREAFQSFHNDMHVKIAKAVNDRDSLHEAALRSAEEPLKREIMHLREELNEERKRFGEKVRKYISYATCRTLALSILHF